MTMAMGFSHFGLMSLFTLGVVAVPLPGFGQSLIVPDDTLGTARSQVDPDGDIDVITGGLRRSQNLFHSFEAFNINAGREASFEIPNGVAAIFSRVTGDSSSNILGTLGTSGGTADLFLMNPNGIVFGPNSSLDIQGSFAAVTADGIQFGEQGVFSAAVPEVPSELLTVDPSAFLFSDLSAGRIVNQSMAPGGLQVGEGKNLLLLGGDVAIRGDLSAFGGRIDIGAVNGAGVVELDANGGLTLSEAVTRGNVILTAGAVANVSRDGGGTIAVTARNITVSDGSLLIAGIRPDLGSTQSQAGDIVLDASEIIRIVGNNNDTGLLNLVFPGGTGNAGNIIITTAVLEVRNANAGLSVSTLGQGNAGNIIISASDRVTFVGDNSAAFSTVGETGVGSGGNINITTAVLELLDGARLSARTLGKGDAGSVIIAASDRVTLSGVSENGRSSGIYTTTADGASGQGGLVSINTPLLVLSDGAVINARTENADQGGTIRVDADDIFLVDGGQIITTALSDGQAGNIILNANQIGLSGRDPTVEDRREEFPEVFANEDDGQSGLFANTRPDSTGSGGNIEVNATVLALNSGALISAQSSGTGTAGTIRINVSDSLLLADSNITTAATASDGGDIFLNTASIAQNAVTRLAGDSDITTNSLGDGGNITIGGTGIVASDDSDIISSSGEAIGGNITLSTLISDPNPPGNAVDFDGNDQVDVNASGAISSGTITTPDTSFIQNSLAELPDTILNTESLITNSCVSRNPDGSSIFNITGAEGLSDRPGGTTINYPIGNVQLVPEKTASWHPGDPIVEPQGLYQLPNGELVMSHAC